MSITEFTERARFGLIERVRGDKNGESMKKYGGTSTKEPYPLRPPPSCPSPEGSFFSSLLLFFSLPVIRQPVHVQHGNGRHHDRHDGPQQPVPVHHGGNGLVLDASQSQSHPLGFFSPQPSVNMAQLPRLAGSLQHLTLPPAVQVPWTQDCRGDFLVRGLV